MNNIPDNRMANGKLASSKFASRYEQLESRTVLSGTAIVQPFSEVDYFGASQDWAINAINAPEVWAAGYTGAGVVVAVLDTGIAPENSQLKDKLWRNDGEIEGNGIDDDLNGYVDDVYGWNFVNDDAAPVDTSGHGTKVAGVIAAQRDAFGSTGIAYDATILPVQILDEEGNGSQLDIADGIRYAVDAGADIINVSLGGSVGSFRVERAINYALENDVLIVAASGNSSDTLPDYPARYSAMYGNTLSVGAFDNDFRAASFNNSVGTSGAVQVDAPGVSVFTTYLGNQFRYGSGTSFAAPVVSGVAALMLSADPDLNASDLRDYIVQGAKIDVIGSDSLGGVDAAYSVASVAPPQQALPSIIAGDVDGDGEVGFLDFLRVSRNFGTSVSSRGDGDLNGDGRVEFLDFLILSRNFGVLAGAQPSSELVDEIFFDPDFDRPSDLPS